ncbi:CBS domain-containing protein [Zhihengliuella halotolerans]|uniref:CBS domain protein n=1 Tax=Zhihengliuella halotolerans TaxID=370736 RepID=A0A4Q8AF85_9MICC|nr:CBS domain-containing protein [Zhihengliuella halotolerans]RZU62405.1 CBS domain protein [Zhihengliuella halotolerans]
MKFTAVVVITPPELEDEAIQTAQRAGATGVTILTGKGIGGELKKTFFGLTFEGSQSVLLMVVGTHLATPILKALHEVLSDGDNSHGMAFNVPVDHLTGIETRQLVKFEEYMRRDDDATSLPGSPAPPAQEDSVLKVQDLMVPDVVTVSPYATLREALATMRARNVKSLVVERQNAHDSYGLLSFTELLRAIVADEGDVDLLNVYDSAVKPAVTVGEELSVRQAAALMTSLHLNRLVVVRGNELVGLLAMNDIIARMMDETIRRD